MNQLRALCSPLIHEVRNEKGLLVGMAINPTARDGTNRV